MNRAEILLPITNSNSSETFREAAKVIHNGRKQKSFRMAVKVALDATAYFDNDGQAPHKLEIIRQLPGYGDIKFGKLGREVVTMLSGNPSSNKGVRIPIDATHIQAVEYPRPRYSLHFLDETNYYKSLGLSNLTVGGMYTHTVHAWEFSGTTLDGFSAHGIVKPGGGGGVLELIPPVEAYLP